MATVYDIITEAYAYPYSKEYFEMEKLQYELALREKYMENVAFYRNDDFNSLVRESDYLSESAYFDTTDSLFFEDGSGATSARTGGLLSRVWEGIKKLFNQFIGFFKKLFLGKKLALDVNDREAIKGAISERVFTAKDVEELAKQTGKTVDEWADLEIVGSNPGSIKTDNSVNTTKKKALKNILSFYLGDKKIEVKNPVELVEQKWAGTSDDKKARIKRVAKVGGAAVGGILGIAGLVAVARRILKKRKKSDSQKAISGGHVGQKALPGSSDVIIIDPKDIEILENVPENSSVTIDLDQKQIEADLKAAQEVRDMMNGVKFDGTENSEQVALFKKFMALFNRRMADSMTLYGRIANMLRLPGAVNFILKGRAKTVRNNGTVTTPPPAKRAALREHRSSDNPPDAYDREGVPEGDAISY